MLSFSRYTIQELSYWPGFCFNVLSPLTKIKIDRSFLYQLETNQRNGSIVSNAIALAHGLGYTVVAEGVEDERVLNMLKHYGCDYIQGFLYSPALKIDEAIRWTQEHNPPHIVELAKQP